MKEPPSDGDELPVVLMDFICSIHARPDLLGINQVDLTLPFLVSAEANPRAIAEKIARLITDHSEALGILIKPEMEDEVE